MANPNGCENPGCRSPEEGELVDVTIQMVTQARCSGCVERFVDELLAADAIMELRAELEDGTELVATRPERRA